MGDTIDTIEVIDGLDSGITTGFNIFLVVQ